MSTWTDSAEKAFEEFVARQRKQVAASGADPEEVAEDLRRHVQEEAAAAGLRTITREDVVRILARVGSAPADSLPEQPKTVRRFIGGVGFVFAILFGVVLPTFTLLFEVITGFCGMALFDPMPTVFHVLLVAMVPASITWVLVCMRKRKEVSTAVGWAFTQATGVACYYALVFLPISPFAVVGIMFMGLGFLPLSPLASFIVALSLRPAVKKIASTGIPPVWKGVLIACAVFLVLDTPKIATQVGMRLAASEIPETRTIGLKVLRTFGQQSSLLRYCYVGDRFAPDIVGAACNLLMKSVSTVKVRDIYYRVTGTPFNAVKPPNVTGLSGDALIDARDFDFDQGGDAVASRIRDLSLADSRIDGKINADEGWSYTEWTMVFRNNAADQHEARAQITLPPGGVVSRLTLWIDGEEREAAFGTRDQTKTAYKQVVARRRDPVLVTTCGKDQILMQCFPVPANGGTMKIRVGITAPLQLESRANAVLELPRFTSCNFDIPEAVAHSVWYESKQPLKVIDAVKGLVTEQPSTNVFAVRGPVANAVMDEGIALGAERNAALVDCWTRDARFDTNSIIRQAIAEHAVDKPDRVVFVIDGSRRMAAYRDDVVKLIESLPPGIDSKIVLAGDKVHDMAGIDALTFDGGCDNVPALLRAWDLAAEKPRGAIIWLHATQPFEMETCEALVQRGERRPDNPLLYDVQFGSGPNTVATKLNGLAAMQRMSGMNGARHGLAQVFAEWQGTAKHLDFKREKLADNAMPSGAEADLHIARLWANENACTLVAARGNASKAEATKLSTAYHLVTPMSGAVVLETKEQFAAAGLEPVDPQSTPSVVPEPGLGGLVVVGTGLMLARRRRNSVHNRS